MVPSIVTVPVIVGSAEARLIVCTPPPAMLNTIVSLPAIALALVIAVRSEPAPALFVLVTVKVASAWSQAASVLALITTEVSISPVAASSCQFAYSATLPVRSVLAATSAPVRLASVFMASSPSAP